MSQVDIIKAQTTIADRRRRKIIERVRVAAYCRVSTDSEDQLNSYRSQVKYYTDLINDKSEWMMAGVYSDEAITGTQVAKREGFRKMIDDCMDGQIDMVITKSISRFARNTLDTLKYVRMLKEKDIAVYFEDEHINTLSMDGELLLVVLSSVAQQEVENISNNVKKGLAMKMSRGEIVGFSGALGYDYDPETKQISVNEEEAKVVQYIFRRYIEGAGSHVIAKELESMGALTGAGMKTWSDSTVIGIVKNEKYTGTLLQGKTFTVDPISKRRLDNQGEVDQYVMKGHHDPIITEEMFEQAQEMLSRRTSSHHNPDADPNEYRTNFSRKYVFSSMVYCGFCGGTLVRRSWHPGTKYEQSIWMCIRATKDGKKSCPHCKGISELAIKSAFVESYRMVTKDEKGVLEEFLQRTEETLKSNSKDSDIEKGRRELEALKMKLSNLLDMHLAGKVDSVMYEQKKQEIDNAIRLKQADLSILKNGAITEKNISARIESMRSLLQDAPALNEFDNKVFVSIVDKVIVGGYDDEGNADPKMITFVYKTGFKDSKDGRMFKPTRINARKELQSPGTDDNMELSSVPAGCAC